MPDESLSRYSPLAYAAACGSFVVMGANNAVLGPVLGTLAHHFGVSLSTAGYAVSFISAGSFTGMLSGRVLMRHVLGRTIMRVSLATLLLGIVLMAVVVEVGTWPFYLLGVYVGGAGFGGLVLAMASLLSRVDQPIRAARMSLANAFYGIGAIVGPLLVVVFHPRHFVDILALMAAAAVVMLLGQRGVEASPLRRVAAHAQPPVRARALPLFALAFFFYVAVESTSTGWIASQLHGVGFSTATGSLVTALFWTTFATGRSLGGWLHRFTPSRVVLVGLVGATLLVPFADVHVVAPFIWPLVGVLIASTWVFGLLWYQQLVGHDPEGFNRIMLTAMLGGVAGPSLTSFVVSLVGVHAVPFMLALFAALDATLFFVALRFNRD